MEKTDIAVKLESVFQSVFKRSDITITREMTAHDVENWDSLNHVQLVIHVEEAFGVKFKLREVLGLKNVGDLIDLIQIKKA
jgi:acyl carrier protein